MGIIEALNNALGSSLDDQMKDVIRPGEFGEYSVLVPGITEEDIELEGSLANGSIIFVPENTCAVIYNNKMIENTISTSGAYVYEDGTCSIFHGDGFRKSFIEKIGDRIGFHGNDPNVKRICYINCREIRNIRFGTRGPILFHDDFYDLDLEMVGFGSFSLKITDPVKFVTEFVSPEVLSCNVSQLMVKNEVVTEILRELKNRLISSRSQNTGINLSSFLSDVEKTVLNHSTRLSEWKDKYGFIISDVHVEQLDYSSESKEIIKTSSLFSYYVSAFWKLSFICSNKKEIYDVYI